MNDDKVNEDPMEFVNQEPDEPVAEPVAEPAPKPTARPRSGTASRNQGNSKLIIGIVAVAVVIAVIILWPRGGGDVDNNVPVMTLENQPVPAVDTPVSSDVNIDEAVTEIIPESSETTTKPEPKPEPEPEPAKVTTTPEPALTAGIGAPGAEGSWGVQVFASSTRQGAENFKAKMDAKGFLLESLELGFWTFCITKPVWKAFRDIFFYLPSLLKINDVCYHVLRP